MAAIKVLIVEDSGLVAEVLTQALESDKRVRVVGVASNGREAIEMLPKLSPDLVTMDVWMPVMDGFDTVEWIMANKPTPILVITSSKLKQDVEISLRMLAAGALDVIEKPSLNDEKQWQLRQTELINKIKLLSSVRVITHVRGKTNPEFKRLVSTETKSATPTLPKPKPPELLKEVERAKETPNPLPASRPTQPPSTSRYLFPNLPHYRVVAIASSTGGPTALLRILQKLPPNLPSPILIVQHISEGFTQGLVEWLQRETPLRLKIARDGEIPRPGEVLLAPDKRDMEIKSDFSIYTTAEGYSALRPNADALMHSVARVYGSQAIGLILTGMGNDGAKGLKEMYTVGAYTIGQDEASSLIYGMPRAAFELGGVRQVLPLNDMPDRLINLLQLPAQPGDRFATTSRDGKG